LYEIEHLAWNHRIGRLLSLQGAMPEETRVVAMRSGPGSSGASVTKSEEYRLNAEECERMARSSRKESDRQDWLSLAQSWRQMIKPERTPEGNIDGPDRNANDPSPCT
jgi:hypothetical protein